MLMAIVERYSVDRPQVILIAGIVYGVLMILFFRFLKFTYATFLTFGMMIPFLMVILGNAKRFLWVTLIICLPITVDISIGDTGHTSGTSGYLLSLFEIVLAGLYIIWFTEMIRRKDMRIEFFPRITIPALFLINGVRTFSILEWV
jgi:hypothetical protein